MKILSLITLFLICAASDAQEAAALYQVEIIVFKQIDADSAIEEIKNVSRPEMKQHKERATLDLYNTDANSSVRAVPAQRLQLTTEAQKIKQDGRYELLYHGAWQQPPYHHSRSPYINILNEPLNGLLKGTAWMSYERYFKLLLEFQYDPEFNRSPEVVDIPQTLSVPIRLERIMREKKLFYIDHPVLGVIAVIQPL